MADPVVDLGQVIEFFNNAAADLPDQTRLKGRKLPSLSVVLDGKGGNFADVFEPGNRRVWVPLAAIPDFVQKAFVAAEDRRFFQHHGVDERGIIRAFIGNLAEPGRPQGGSTITQQVVKNLLVGEDVTYERKIREMIVASRLENTLSKPEILELYLNSAYLGRGSWGVKMARALFRQISQDLTLAEGAMLAGLLRPELLQFRPPSRPRPKSAWPTCCHMQEDRVIGCQQKDGHSPRRRSRSPSSGASRHRLPLHRFLGREPGDRVENLTANSYTVHSTIDERCARHRGRRAGGFGTLQDLDGACSSTAPKPISRLPSKAQRRQPAASPAGRRLPGRLETALATVQLPSTTSIGCRLVLDRAASAAMARSTSA